MNKPILIAHRGDTKNFPENSMKAFFSAIEKGSDGIEFDVHLNQQRVPIIVHNYCFDPNKQYPLLTEVLEQFGKKTRLEMEIKSLEAGAVTKIAKITDRFRPLHLEITSSVPLLFCEFAKYFANDSRGLIFKRNLLEDWMSPDFVIYWITRHMDLAKATVLHLDLDLYSPKLVEALHQNGILAHTHIKDASKETFEKIKQLKIDQCTFDDIEVLKPR
jgi:glycerophosphoryl diester phosphodiesterase